MLIMELGQQFKVLIRHALFGFFIFPWMKDSSFVPPFLDLVRIIFHSVLACPTFFFYFSSTSPSQLSFYGSFSIRWFPHAFLLIFGFFLS
jgi:hypothetical protein